ncbi:MAG: hypothetical protein KQ78_01845 [Candidatus Izimaplasma bacterium HR2]|nr:MAG: hypothetical protein KQ78_01845 [Candidatus Izimaplasma bacterium HR2]
MLNLRREGEGGDIRLKKVRTTVGKDKFSALENGLYYIYLLERDKRKKLNIDVKAIVKMTKKTKKQWKRWK